MIYAKEDLEETIIEGQELLERLRWNKRQRCRWCGSQKSEQGSTCDDECELDAYLRVGRGFKQHNELNREDFILEDKTIITLVDRQKRALITLYRLSVIDPTPIRMFELAGVNEKARKHMSSTCDKLIEKGLLVSSKLKGGRSRLVAITARGKQVAGIMKETTRGYV
jgi:DNA-binding MarR family transcriptional regulator